MLSPQIAAALVLCATTVGAWAMAINEGDDRSDGPRAQLADRPAVPRPGPGPARAERSPPSRSVAPGKADLRPRQRPGPTPEARTPEPQATPGDDGARSGEKPRRADPPAPARAERAATQRVRSAPDAAVQTADPPPGAEPVADLDALPELPADPREAAKLLATLRLADELRKPRTQEREQRDRALLALLLARLGQGG